MKGPLGPLHLLAFLALLGAVLETTVHGVAWSPGVWAPKVPILALYVVALLRASRRRPAPGSTEPSH